MVKRRPGDKPLFEQWWRIYASLGLNELSVDNCCTKGVGEGVNFTLVLPDSSTDARALGTSGVSTDFKSVSNRRSVLSSSSLSKKMIIYRWDQKYITSRPRQMTAVFQATFLNWFPWMKIYQFWLRFHWSLFSRIPMISLNFVLKGQINNIPSLVQIMAGRRPGEKPLSEPMIF